MSSIGDACFLVEMGAAEKRRAKRRAAAKREAAEVRCDGESCASRVRPSARTRRDECEARGRAFDDAPPNPRGAIARANDDAGRARERRREGGGERD